jgi:hypothetical protein
MNFFALLLFAASCAYGLSRWLKLPSLPVLIASGMALNLSGLLPADIGLGAASTGGDDHANATMRILEFGLLFLVFASGVELAPRRFSSHTRTVGWVAGIQFSVFTLIGIATSRWIVGLPWLESCYLGFGLAASSTLVVLRQLRVRKAMFEPFGRVLTGVLLLQDVALIAVIVVLSRVSSGNSHTELGNASRRDGNRHLEDGGRRRLELVRPQVNVAVYPQQVPSVLRQRRTREGLRLGTPCNRHRAVIAHEVGVHIHPHEGHVRHGRVKLLIRLLDV